MPTFSTRKNIFSAFEVDGICLFKQYFDWDDVFDAFKSYYNNNHLFEVLEDGLRDIRQKFNEYFDDFRITDNLYSYCVVKQKDSNYSGILEKQCVDETPQQPHYLLYE